MDLGTLESIKELKAMHFLSKMTIWRVCVRFKVALFIKTQREKKQNERERKSIELAHL